MNTSELPDPRRSVVEVRRPAAARWIILIAILVLVGFFLSLAMRDGDVMIGFLAIPAALVGMVVLRARSNVLRFDGETVSDDTGVVLCRIEDIEKLERGFAPLKPSSGFVIRTFHAQPAAWSPGLWWRFGRRIGVGGATSARAGRNMANAIELVRAGVLGDDAPDQDGGTTKPGG
ncbi:MAG: hypothetical protein ACPGFA_07630 [Pikeienuella sp.]